MLKICFIVESLFQEAQLIAPFQEMTKNLFFNFEPLSFEHLIYTFFCHTYLCVVNQPANCCCCGLVPLVCIVVMVDMYANVSVLLAYSSGSKCLIVIYSAR